LFHAPERTAFPGHWDLFEDAAYRHGLEPVLWGAYRQRDGSPNVEAYAVAPLQPRFEMPGIEKALTATLGEDIELLGVNLPQATARRSENLRLQLIWRATGAPDGNYKVFVHGIADNGQLVAQQDSPPVLGSRPTAAWRPGEFVLDPVRIRLPKDAPVGTLRLFVGMYNEATGERQPLLVGGKRVAGDTLEIGTIEVTP
jgi:hypothetical protein